MLLGPPESWPAPEKGNPALYAGPMTSTKTSEIFSRDQVSQTNGVFKDQNQRDKGFFSKGGVDSSEFLKNSHACSSAIEALMPKLLHSDYFTEPGIQVLAAKEQADPGYSKQVVDFVVGRQVYIQGSICYSLFKMELPLLHFLSQRRVVV